jgi:hypothetical protein
VDNKGFVGALFDLSFSEFITTKLIKILYVLLLILIGIGYLVAIIAGFADGFLRGLLAIITGGIGAAISVIMARVWMELIIVLFRIAENTTELVRMKRNQY